MKGLLKGDIDIDIESYHILVIKPQPGEPAAHNSGLLETNKGLLWGIVAYYFQLLGCPEIEPISPKGGCNKRLKSGVNTALNMAKVRST